MPNINAFVQVEAKSPRPSDFIGLYVRAYSRDLRIDAQVYTIITICSYIGTATGLVINI